MGEAAAHLGHALAAEEGRLEVDLQVEAKVVALCRAAAAAAALAACTLLPAEEGLEDVAQIEILHVRRAALALDARLAELVVSRAQILVRQHLPAAKAAKVRLERRMLRPPRRGRWARRRELTE